MQCTVMTVISGEISSSQDSTGLSPASDSCQAPSAASEVPSFQYPSAKPPASAETCGFLP